MNGGKMSLNIPKETDIVWLFDEVWPLMKYSAMHRDQCRSQYSLITQIFKKHKNNGDLLLNTLTSVNGIDLTIGSGLIYSANTDSMVPFDQWTTGYALELHILPNATISRNYTKYCSLIETYVKRSSQLKTILDFVLEAGDNCQFPYDPE
jgi:hypothetical protein